MGGSDKDDVAYSHDPSAFRFLTSTKRERRVMRGSSCPPFQEHETFIRPITARKRCLWLHFIYFYFLCTQRPTSYLVGGAGSSITRARQPSVSLRLRRWADDEGLLGRGRGQALQIEGGWCVPVAGGSGGGVESRAATSPSHSVSVSEPISAIS